ncbi:hypothetical protein Aple_099650 [Acrocarpospora pleiomorpha]|uniref:Ferredoxin n=1 Tax=Acrocarpospora pleiomorpha TaxID=90975 RepID=A0A5M3Y1I6_9ACTN|nr:ferredoxin [Acrocarpospora pleiomorpha]GES27066.1 hypothetical protein Aple_099650 [Acrocarpospora pleiomorpha]
MASERIRTSQIKLDRELCIGAGMCESVAPEAFVVDEDGLVEFGPGLAALGDEPLDDESYTAAAAAAAVCPAQAIIFNLKANA